jgi:hypothetical protein
MKKAKCYKHFALKYGKVADWHIATDLKSVDDVYSSSAGSNPTLSIFTCNISDIFFSRGVLWILIY